MENMEYSDSRLEWMFKELLRLSSGFMEVQLGKYARSESLEWIREQVLILNEGLREIRCVQHTKHQANSQSEQMELNELKATLHARDRVERTLTQENEFRQTETAFLAMKIEEVKMQLEELRFDTMTATALNSSPRFKHSEGASSQARSTSGSREFKIPFNAEVTGASSREVSSQSASDVGRKYVGMGPDDWRCPDCKGWVWASRAECDNRKCQHRRQEKTSTTTEV